MIEKGELVSAKWGACPLGRDSTQFRTLVRSPVGETGLETMVIFGTTLWPGVVIQSTCPLFKPEPRVRTPSIDLGEGVTVLPDLLGAESEP